MELGIAISVIYLAGFLIFSLLKRYLRELKSLSLFLKLGIFWSLGLAMVSTQLLLYSWLKLGWNIWLLDLPWLLLLALYFVIDKKKISLRSINLKDIIGIVALLVITYFLTYRTLKVPVWDWDGWGNWNFKAQVFFLKGSVPFGFLTNKVLAVNSHMDYPLLVPLSQVWIYQHLGSINSEISKIIFPISFFSILCMFCGGLRQSSKKYAFSFIFTILLALTPNFIDMSQVNYADLILSMAASCAFILGFLWVKEKKTDFMFLSLIFLGICGWIKDEGQIIFLFGATLILAKVLLQRDKKITRKFSLGLILATLIWLPWYIYARHFHLAYENIFSNLNFSFARSHLAKIQLITQTFRDLMNLSTDWGLFWVIFLLSAIYGFITRAKNYFYFLIIFAWILIYMFIYYFEPHNFPVNMYVTSLPRLLIHLFPAAAFIVSITIMDIWKVKKIEPSVPPAPKIPSPDHF